MSQRFGSHVAEFSSLLDTNHLSHGSPADFFPFAETLEKNNSFRLDLSGLVKSIAQKEDGELLLTDMMSIIAAAVCGPSYADSSIDLTGPSNTLMEFLLGTGLWKQFGSPSPRPQRTEPVAPAPAEPQLGRVEPPVEIKEQRQRSSAVPPVPIPPPASATTAPADSAERANLLDASSELRQTLTRLEINTLQVKLHLESIEQRINKIEPAAEGTATTADLPFTEPLPQTAKKEPSVIEPFRGSSVVSATKAETPKVETQTDDVLLPIDPPLFGSLSSSSRSRAVFSHPEPEPEYDNDFTAPTFGYGTERRSAVPIVIIVILALLVAAFFFFTRTDSGQRMLQSGKEHVAAIRSSANSGNLNHSQPASPPASSPPQKTASPPSATTPPSSTPSQTATNNPSSASLSAAQSKNQPSDAESADASDEAAAEARHPNLRYVPANVMEGNLLAAPRPVYPQSARSARLEGIVALQATISRSGSVMTLHVIRGPRELRSAAIDAVRRWRYRPYEVDGRPVQVTTNIYVHFNLGPPPTLVH